jgi:hypothetical protein
VFKLVNAAAKTWRRLKGENQLPKVVQGVKFKMESRSPKCRLTTPPDQPRHPKYCLALRGELPRLRCAGDQLSGFPPEMVFKRRHSVAA